MSLVVYAESNFVLELALRQAEATSCAELLELSRVGALRLKLPAHALVEPFQTLRRRKLERIDLVARLERESVRLARQEGSGSTAQRLEDMALSLSTSASERERASLETVAERLTRHCEILPLGGPQITRAAAIRRELGMDLDDSIVLASVLIDLETTADRPAGCLLSRDEDFAEPSVKKLLKRYGCRHIRRFDDGLAFVRSRPEST